MAFGARSARSVVAVACGGAIGAGIRFEIGLRFATDSSAFPVTTLAINLVGAFVLGVLLTLVLEHWPPTRYVRPFAAIGILGGFTTFSTFAVETARLLQVGRGGLAMSYLFASLVGGMIAVIMGVRIADLWPRLVRRGSR